jgi:hypothetical protein
MGRNLLVITSIVTFLSSGCHVYKKGFSQHLPLVQISTVILIRRSIGGYQNVNMQHWCTVLRTDLTRFQKYSG